MPTKIKAAFKLYSLDIMHLIHHVTEEMPNGNVRFLHSDFDVMENGDIIVHVEGKEALKL